MRFVDLPATECDNVLSDYSHTSTLRTRTEAVFETLIIFTAQPFHPADSLRELHLIVLISTTLISGILM
jgi:hypothetical protein